jgi:hypothetical protein
MSSQPQDKFAAQQLFLRCTTSQSMLSLSALVRSVRASQCRQNDGFEANAVAN